MKLLYPIFVSGVTALVLIGVPRTGFTQKVESQSLQTQSSAKLSSLTVQQIVARRQDYLAQIQSSIGTVVWRETRAADPKTTAAPINIERVIFYGKSGMDDAVNLVMTREGAKEYGYSQGAIPWKEVLSATMIKGDWVYSIDPKKAETSPQVIKLPYNPAVHENNPLVTFDPSQIGEERIPLRELAQSIPDMPTKPNVFDVVQNGQLYHRIEFVNANAPGEVFYYVVDPSKGFLTREIGRISNNKVLLKTNITIGQVPGGLSIPARKERKQYDSAGNLISSDSWFYESFEANGKIPPKMLSYMFFHLPESTKVTTVGGDAAHKKKSQPQASPAGGPMPPPPQKSVRVAPTPLVVPIGKK